jgi:hypothetical protein
MILNLYLTLSQTPLAAGFIYYFNFPNKPIHHIPKWTYIAHLSSKFSSLNKCDKTQHLAIMLGAVVLGCYCAGRLSIIKAEPL